MNCPVCRDVQLVMSDRQGVEIDYCPKCRGVWLDRGELDKILERAGREAGESRGPDRDRDRDRDRDYDRERYEREKHYKKKSWWHEIFD